MFFKQIELIKLKFLSFKGCKNICKNSINIKIFIKINVILYKYNVTFDLKFLNLAKFRPAV